MKRITVILFVLGMFADGIGNTPDDKPKGVSANASAAATIVEPLVASINRDTITCTPFQHYIIRDTNHITINYE